MKTAPLAVSLLTLLLCGCFSSDNPAALKEHTADATAAVAHGAGEVLQGVVEGLTRKGPADLNSAPAARFARLPGITPELASAIVAGRPYARPADLVQRRILTRSQFNRIKAQLVVRPAPPTTRP